MKINGTKIRAWLRKLLQFVFNPRFLLCFGIAWMITNGWSYILLGLGTYFEIAWMAGIAGAYVAFLWLPISPEKIVTVSIAMVLLKFMFPKDEKTLGVLEDLYADIKIRHAEKKERRRARKAQKCPSDQQNKES
ncbi:MAG: hypothetical protein IJW40_11365 [Clostridia bacterium]|nr:hypothetical protein [Clostridia bacterium]